MFEKVNSQGFFGIVVAMLCASVGTDDCIICRDPALTKSFPFIREKPGRLSPGRSRDHNLDRNGDDDGTGATAAIGATDIHPRDGSSDNGRPHSNRAGIVGSPDQRKL